MSNYAVYAKDVHTHEVLVVNPENEGNTGFNLRSVYEWSGDDPKNKDGKTVYHGDIPIDLDCSNPDELVPLMKTVYNAFHALGLPEEAIRLYASGNKGFHIMISRECVGDNGDENLPLIHYRMLKRIFGKARVLNYIDKAMYHTGRPQLLRKCGSVNPKSNRKKIQMDWEPFRGKLDGEKATYQWQYENALGAFEIIGETIPKGLPVCDTLNFLYMEEKNALNTAGNAESDAVDAPDDDLDPETALERLPFCVREVAKYGFPEEKFGAHWYELLYTMWIPAYFHAMGTRADGRRAPGVTPLWNWIMTATSSNNPTPSNKTDQFRKSWRSISKAKKGKWSCKAVTSLCKKAPAGFSGDSFYTSMCARCPVQQNRDRGLQMQLVASTYGNTNSGVAIEVIDDVAGEALKEVIEEKKNTWAEAIEPEPWEHIIDEDSAVDYMNRRACFITGTYSPKVYSVSGFGSHCTYSLKDIPSLYSAWPLVVNSEKKGTIKINPAKLWLDSPRKNMAQGLTWNPGQPYGLVDNPTTGVREFNLWTGWVRKHNGRTRTENYEEVRPMLDYVREELCQNDSVLYRTVMSWAASIVKDPAGVRLGRAQYMVVFTGPAGSGKSLFGRMLSGVLEPYGAFLESSQALSSNFNGLMDKKLFVFVDEAGEGHRAEIRDKLKSLITSETIRIERKGAEAVLNPNFLRLGMASNDDLPFKAEKANRKFLLLRASGNHTQDEGYWKPLYEILRSEEKMDALFSLLMDWEEKEVSLIYPPETEAEMMAKFKDAPVLLQWWYSRLTGAKRMASFLATEDISTQTAEDWQGTVVTQDWGCILNMGTLWEDYRDFSHDHMSEATLRMRLREILPKEPKDVKVKTSQIWVGNSVEAALRTCEKCMGLRRITAKG